jgi:hypothetical protein
MVFNSRLYVYHVTWVLRIVGKKVDFVGYFVDYKYTIEEPFCPKTKAFFA